MRSPTTAGVVVAILALALAVAAFPALAQEEEGPTATEGGFERPSVGVPVEGDERDDGTIVLANQDFCSYLMSEIWGTDKLTYRDLIDRTKKQKKARAAAFECLFDSL